MTIRYSPAPPEAYTLTHEGQLYGIGINPVFQAVTGAWNLLWLLAAPHLDKLLHYTGPSEDYPTYMPVAVPPAVATALQQTGEGLTTWGELAEELQPKKLVRKMKAASGTNIPFIVQIHGDIIIHILEDNAKTWVPPSDNVVWLDVWKKKVQ